MPENLAFVCMFVCVVWFLGPEFIDLFEFFFSFHFNFRGLLLDFELDLDLRILKEFFFDIGC